MKKTLKRWKAGAVMVLSVIVIMFTACSSSKQTIINNNNEAIIKAIDSSNWKFTPIRMIPQFGNSRQIFGNYEVIYSKGKFNVYLPYYGRAYAGADILSNESPLDFISTNFTVDKRLVKEGEWNIIIKPIDRSAVQTMNFTLFSNGSADLNVTLLNRSPISFTGNVGVVKE
ncbi:DUF4251 domain-containing protein [Ferruginibacter lapsinanis]|uniref:DUF4251 domain-containing protein n=1 Tax=Ferruginibacter lapsinanis TaxID=563172 RepID=UPI001E3669FC|nr:DUF4251 domain-containing protein [Ferruginibacter lapsinanis]UEG50787.1 DUF4251 domain-containing protein [Ferruginibacter lapsinanis]